jgi:hypothetical protein
VGCAAPDLDRHSVVLRVRRGPYSSLTGHTAHLCGFRVGLQLGDAVELILSSDSSDTKVQWTTRTVASMLSHAVGGWTVRPSEAKETDESLEFVIEVCIWP